MGCERCTKVLFYSFNVILLILGLASLGVGIWMAIDPQSAMDVTRIGELETISPSLVRVSGYIMISAGGATVLFALMGIIGACKESTCLLGMYIALLVLALALQVAAIVLGVVFRDRINEELDTRLSESLQKYEGPTSKDTKSSAWNTFMKEAKCCGVNNATVEFMGTKWDMEEGNYTDLIIPSVCCKKDKMCMKMPNDDNSHINTGCLKKLNSLIFTYQAVVIGISAGIVGFQFLLVILAVCLFSQRNPEYKMGKD